MQIRKDDIVIVTRLVNGQLVEDYATVKGQSPGCVKVEFDDGQEAVYELDKVKPAA
jgi:hypothetical protein